MKKRKENKILKGVSVRKNREDEVWKTIKEFLKKEGIYGKEIYDSYFIKRNHENYVNPIQSHYLKNKKKYEIKIRRWQKENERKELLASGKPLEPDYLKNIYVLCFSLRDAKTNEIYQPRCIECEVVEKRIDKKTTDRKIVINGEKDYDKEMEWIAPIKAAEEYKLAQIYKKQQKKKKK
jgi:hypothetical protein